MHVLLTNDDGPLDDVSCPYIKYLADEISRSTDWKLSIVVPNQQRSWIGKAHLAGKSLTRSYLYTKRSTDTENDSINDYKGPFEQRQKDLSDHQEWNLIDSTPGACTDIGVNHLFPDVDLVISGPNFGKNSSNLYILASGTVGAAMEAVLHNKKAIGLSYSYSQKNHPYEEIKEASKISVKIIEKLYLDGFKGEEELYTINVPLNRKLKLGSTRAYFTPILGNKWGQSVYEKLDENNFNWNPNFKLVYNNSLKDFNHSDSRVLLGNDISITALRAKFNELPSQFGELKLLEQDSDDIPKYLLLTIQKSDYIYEILKQEFTKNNFIVTDDHNIVEKLPNVKIFHYGEYEDLKFDIINQYPENYFIPSNVYRKGLIRKNYLSNLIHHYVVKNPKLILASSYPTTHSLELDYAEFLDDALDESYELRQDIEQNDKIWILKPSMSDKGQGIRLFKTVDQLQEIFNSFEENEEDNEEEEEKTQQIEEKNSDSGIITSQLRHFIVQEYQPKPLLLSEYGNKKFHFRTYVVTNGNLQVFLYKNILTLFASQEFKFPDQQHEPIDLNGHLTNTCLQTETPLVESFWNLKGLTKFEKEIIFNKICQILNQLFLAAITIDKINYQPLVNATEFFGIDFIINEDLELTVLECNAYPDFKQTGEELKGLVDDLFVSTINEVIIPNMNHDKRVPNDTSLVDVLNIDNNY